MSYWIYLELCFFVICWFDVCCVWGNGLRVGSWFVNGDWYEFGVCFDVWFDVWEGNEILGGVR